MSLRALAAAIACAATGCYTPDIAPCFLACAAGDRCPDGLACNAQGLCAESATQTCSGGDGGPPVTTTVTVDVVAPDNTPMPNVRVVFASTDGELLRDATTDTLGRATAEVPVGSSATVIRNAGVNSTGTTYLDLWENAHVVSRTARATGTRSVTMEWTAATGSTAQYSTFVSCGAGNPITSQSAPQIVSVAAECPRFDVVVLANNPQFMPTHYAVRADLPAPTTSVDLGSDWHMIGSVNLNVMNLATGGVANLHAVPSPALPFAPPIAVANLPPSGMANLLFPAGLPIVASIRTSLLVGGNEEASQTHLELRPSNTTTVAIDLATVRFPWITEPELDAGSRTLYWTITPNNGATRMPSVAFASIAFNRGQASYLWHVIAPGGHVSTANGRGSFVLPDIPGDNGFEPSSGDDTTSTMHYFGVTPGTEDEVRAHLESHEESLDLFGVPGLLQVTRTSATL